jgi:hypothetical protein
MKSLSDWFILGLAPGKSPYRTNPLLGRSSVTALIVQVDDVRPKVPGTPFVNTDVSAQDPGVHPRVLYSLWTRFVRALHVSESGLECHVSSKTDGNGSTSTVAPQGPGDDGPEQCTQRALFGSQ